MAGREDFSFRLVMNESAVKRRFSAKAAIAQKQLANEVLEDTTDYVPYRTGRTSNSGQAHADCVTWGPSDYVRSIYYSTRNFGKMYHPKATGQWFEKSKAVNLSKWVGNVQKNMKG